MQDVLGIGRSPREHSIDFGKLEHATAPLQLRFGRYMVNSGVVKHIGGLTACEGPGQILNRQAAKSSVRNFGSGQYVQRLGTAVISSDLRSTTRSGRLDDLGS
jgi:hypothetical protein